MLHFWICLHIAYLLISNSPWGRLSNFIIEASFILQLVATTKARRLTIRSQEDHGLGHLSCFHIVRDGFTLISVFLKLYILKISRLWFIGLWRRLFKSFDFLNHVMPNIIVMTYKSLDMQIINIDFPDVLSSHVNERCILDNFQVMNVWEHKRKFCIPILLANIILCSSGSLFPWTTSGT